MTETDGLPDNSSAAVCNIFLNFFIRYVISSAHLTTYRYKPQRFVILHTNPIEKIINFEVCNFDITNLKVCNF